MENLEAVLQEVREKEQQRQRKEDRLKRKLLRKLRKKVRRARFKSGAARVPCRVQQVHVDGLRRTRAQVVLTAVQPVFAASNYGELVELTKEAHRSLKTLGCFSAVDIDVDVSRENERGVDLTVTVKEKPWIGFQVNSRVSDNCDVVTAATVQFPNLLGGGESLTLEAGGGLARNETVAGISLVREAITSTFGHLAIIASSTWNSGSILWRESALTGSVWANQLSLVTQPFRWLQHQITLSGDLRRVSPAARPSAVATSSPPRKECGFSQKVGLSHRVTLDTRDDRVLPTRGCLLEWLQEAAGIGGAGNVSYFKQMGVAGVHAPLGQTVSLGLSSRFGYLRPSSIAGSGIPYSSLDVLAFPSTLGCRGWNLSGREVKERELDNCLQVLSSVSLKLTSKLPFLRGDSWLNSNLRTHLFCDYGSVGSLQDNALSTSSLFFGLGASSLQRLSAGIGLVCRLGSVGRAELNFCVPLFSKPSFSSSPWCFQFGLGLDYI